MKQNKTIGEAQEQVKKELKILKEFLLKEFSITDLDRIGGEWWRLKEDGSYTYPWPSSLPPSRENKTLEYFQPAILAYCAGNEFLITNDPGTFKIYLDNKIVWQRNKKIVLQRDAYLRSRTAKSPCITKANLNEKLESGKAVATIAKSLKVTPTQIYNLINQYGLTLPSKK